MVCLCVRLTARLGEEERVAALFPQLQEQSRREPGCRQYQVHRHADDPRRFLIYEQYIDDAALAAHRESAHFRELAPGAIYPLVESREVESYRPL